MHPFPLKAVTVSRVRGDGSGLVCHRQPCKHTAPPAGVPISARGPVDLKLTADTLIPPVPFSSSPTTCQVLLLLVHGLLTHPGSEGMSPLLKLLSNASVIATEGTHHTPTA